MVITAVHNLHSKYQLPEDTQTRLGAAMHGTVQLSMHVLLLPMAKHGVVILLSTLCAFPSSSVCMTCVSRSSQQNLEQLEREPHPQSANKQQPRTVLISTACETQPTCLEPYFLLSCCSCKFFLFLIACFSMYQHIRTSVALQQCFAIT